MAHSPTNSGLKNMRDFFTRSEKEKIPPELKHALSLLQLPNLDSLEERFLATAAFLEPWAVFRDSIFLRQPEAVPRATAIAREEGEDGVSRTDLLWFYTRFDEGVHRYDPRADKHSAEYTSDSSVHGVIDKSDWTVEAYEKHLFAWLLQVFKVGKSRNPWNIDYFELRNICTAWEIVFVPIVNAVRASYSVKGRRHYGRLALYIEERCPSGLAFPKDNVLVPGGSLMSPTPYRIISLPKKAVSDEGATFHKRVGGAGVFTRKQYDEAEKELRDVYPQYGGLVERPKFKHKMEEWLNEQRARAERRKAAEKTGEARAFQPQVIKRDGSRSSGKSSSPDKDRSRQDQDGSESPIRRYSDSIRRSLSRGISRMASKEEPKSPLHGVTRQIHLPDETPAYRPSEPSSTERHVSGASTDTTIITPWPRPDTVRKPSDQSVYTSTHNSDTLILPDSHQRMQMCDDTDESIYSPMGQLSAIPQPLHHKYQPEMRVAPTIEKGRAHPDARVPSYEGSGWDDEISLTKLKTVREDTARDLQRVQPSKPVTRLPVPIKPTAYTGDLRIASNDIHRKATPNPLAWPGTSPPRAVPWPGMEHTVPSVSSRSPERWNSTRGLANSARPQRLLRDESDRSVTRIVSKENIRSVLKGNSRDSSAEDLTLPPPVPMLPGQNRTMSPAGARLQTYNTNLFPRREERKGTPVGGWVGADKSRGAHGGPFELDMLDGANSGQGVQSRTAGGDTRYHEGYHGRHEPDDRRSLEKWI
ncbi:uncharacterized protein J4E92_000994 [Alternaria infectoria]|uniref:uncharacterized protein n=1 Tax=Alternaria triticimaculans TaxID=297637 RepID=UPI0020C1E519|nr:uncharacterized protein J4E78_000991 [Alternaria triticimaculans]XP_051357920.1 uncharacterized protein J4E92_000994 [Alternaria infectoria]KAI4623841.1 hypothetical protein J4E80_003653 [Alternaria sp. BMP 0032]KAI4709529.1 hypothetical protein J4E89_005545 [Alternaria sp. Ai002NY15]KAI4672490.1 hypothetical protein J4E78_000991 [Alternaria triticimaculans]KAI4939708.1 hypothetical protein J4E92_000994 [Alternaria infectoria]